MGECRSTAQGLGLTVLLACAGAQAQEVPTALRPLSERPVDESRVERLLKTLTPREKVAQLLLAYPQLDGEGPVEVGGVLFIGRGLHNLEKAKQRIASLRKRARIPPFFAADVEGGVSNRMKRHPKVRALPSAAGLARLSELKIEAWGIEVGQAMREVGLNMNLAPVVDVAGSGHLFGQGRTFGPTPKLVSRRAGAFARGLLQAGVIPIGKHFPGYGTLSGDSDHELVRADWTEAQLEEHISAFERIGGWLGGVMMSNVAYTRVGPRPAILNPTLVARAHRSEWLAMTDDVAIAVLSQAVESDSAEVVRQAFLAGNDVLLSTAPPDWDRGLDFIGILLELSQSTPERQAQLDASVRRILRLKDRMGMLEGL